MTNKELAAQCLIEAANILNESSKWNDELSKKFNEKSSKAIGHAKAKAIRNIENEKDSMKKAMGYKTFFKLQNSNYSPKDVNKAVLDDMQKDINNNSTTNFKLHNKINNQNESINIIYDNIDFSDILD